MKKGILFTVVLFFCLQNLFAQNKIEPVDTTAYYAFYINYWFNMHHFLWLESFLNTKADSTLIATKLSPEVKNKLDNALQYYNENLVEEDLRMSEYMSSFKNWITDQNRDLDTIPTAFKEHMKILLAFDTTYKKEFWPLHKQACETVLEENLDLIKKMEESFVEQITKLTRQFWQFEKIKIDITCYAKSDTWNLRNRPYTTLFPTHVVMNAIGENEVKGNWIELLYHESAHHLILGHSYFVAGTIKDYVEVEGIKAPRQLGHAYLFYFTGILTKQLLTEQNIDYPTIYMVRNKVFSRYYYSIEKHLDLYIDRKITLVEATERIINDLNNQKK